MPITFGNASITPFFPDNLTASNLGVATWKLHYNNQENSLL